MITLIALTAALAAYIVILATEGCEALKELFKK